MKYQRLVSNTTPASLQDWLEEELESRGIDGVYTRYILSLLQQDYLDLEPSECQHTKLTGHHRKIYDQYGCKDYVLSFSKARSQKLRDLEKGRLFGSTTPCCGFDFALNLEERNKNAAVECLKSASEEKIDVEKLVEEVCMKLKNAKTTTSDENSTGDSKAELNDQVEKQLEEISPSSPKDQAEKYYAAFPALNDKTEPMTELCLQQKKSSSSGGGGPWRGRLNKETIDENLEENDVHISFKNGIENTPLKNKERISLKNDSISTDIQEHAMKEFKVIDHNTKKCDETEISHGPSFIVPKMKTSLPRKPLYVRYLPFNQPLKHVGDIAPTKELSHLTNSDLLIADFDPLNLTVVKEKFVGNRENLKHLQIVPDSPPKSTEGSGESKKSHLFEDGSEQGNVFENVFENFCDCEKLGILMCAALTDVSNSGLCNDDNILIEKLLSKFNNSLAAIWGTKDQSTNTCKSISEGAEGKFLELSSVEASDLNESVWTYKKEGSEENFDITKLTSSTLSDTSQTPSSKDTPDLCQENDLDSDATTVELTDSLSRDVQAPLEFENDSLSQDIVSECILNEFLEDCLVADDQASLIESPEEIPVVCPKPYFPIVDKVTDVNHVADTSIEKNIALVKSDLKTTPGIYSLWHSSSDTSLALDQNLKKIWDPSPLDESSNWLVLPVGDKTQKGNLENKDFLTSQQSAKISWGKEIKCDPNVVNPLLSKEKCTLTYHKGESKFVEVVPSHKQKLNVIDYPGERESLTNISSGSALSNVVYLEYLSDDDFEEENLLTSPKTHFQPIRQDSHDTDNSEDLEVMMLTYEGLGNSPVADQSLNDLNSAGNVYPLVSELRKSPKQLHRKKIKKIRNKIVSPRKIKLITPSKETKRKRAISSSFDEMVSLTGNFPTDRSEQDSLPHITHKSNLYHFWNGSNFKDKGTNTDISQSLLDGDRPVKPTAIARPSDRMYNKMYFSPETEVWDLNGYQDVPIENKNPPEWKWSTNDNSSIEEDQWFQTCGPDWTHVNKLKEKDIAKPFGSNSDIHALRRELKEEEEELLRDICYISSTCSEDDVAKPNGISNIIIGRNGKNFIKKHGKLSQHSLPKGIDDELINEETVLQQNNFLKWNDSDENFNENIYQEFYDGSFTLNGLDVEDSSHPCFPSVPADKILYSSDLEDEWRRNSQSFGIQIPQRHLKYKSPPQKRPCSFYLEGNCRRSDCRFSHDLSTITCRFWEEGSCFKGITCPFLHGYIGDMDYHGRTDTPDCNYTLESEADFPSLSAPKTGAAHMKSNPQEIVLDKVNRQKRKKGRSHSSWNTRKSAQSMVSSSWPGCKTLLDSLEYSPE